MTQGGSRRHMGEHVDEMQTDQHRCQPLTGSQSPGPFQCSVSAHGHQLTGDTIHLVFQFRKIPQRGKIEAQSETDHIDQPRRLLNQRVTQSVMDQLAQTRLQGRTPVTGRRVGEDDPTQRRNPRLPVCRRTESGLRWHVELNRQDGIGLSRLIEDPFRVQSNPQRVTAGPARDGWIDSERLVLCLERLVQSQRRWIAYLRHGAVRCARTGQEPFERGGIGGGHVGHTLGEGSGRQVGHGNRSPKGRPMTQQVRATYIKKPFMHGT